MVCGRFRPEPASRLLTLAAAIVTNIILVLVYSVLGSCATWVIAPSVAGFLIEIYFQMVHSTKGRYETPFPHTTIKWEARIVTAMGRV